MDYQLRLADRGGAGISNLEYKDFRTAGNGTNFCSEDEELKLPNNSLVSSLVTHPDGDRLSRRGYWGDIITGPFISYGLEYKKEVKFIDRISNKTVSHKFPPEIMDIFRPSLRALLIFCDRELSVSRFFSI